MTPYNASDMIRSINRTFGLSETRESSTESPVRLQGWLASLIRRPSPGKDRPR